MGVGDAAIMSGEEVRGKNEEESFTQKEVREEDDGDEGDEEVLQIDEEVRRKPGVDDKRGIKKLVDRG